MPKGTEDQLAAPKAESRGWSKAVNAALAIALLHACLALAIVIAMKGSKWPTAGFFLAGGFLSLPATFAVRKVARDRLQRVWLHLISLALVLLPLWGIAYAGKHPDPAEVFREAFGNPPPNAVSQLTAVRGWWDGSITVLHFQSDDTTIRRLLPAGAQCTDMLKQASAYRTGVIPGRLEAQWLQSTVFGDFIDPSIKTFPGWTAPWSCTWPMPTWSGAAATVQLTWDAKSGQAIVVHADDP
jgi:hypothetical protein